MKNFQIPIQYPILRAIRILENTPKKSNNKCSPRHIKKNDNFFLKRPPAPGPDGTSAEPAWRLIRSLSSLPTLKNGVRYRVVAITDEGDGDPCFELIQVNDEGTEIGASFVMDKRELGSKMRLTHAITYFSSQARTIVSGLRLAQTDSKLFTLRHLIVGLGRAPIGADVQVE